MPAGFVWTGGYVGLQAGYAWGDTSVSFPSSAIYFSKPDADGFIGGIYAGYNHQLPNNLVLGVEADINYSNADGVDFLSRVGFPPALNEEWQSEIKWTAALRARVGYSLDRTLLYVAVGVALADLEVGVYDWGVLRDEVSDTLTGWTVGVGAEHAFTDNLVARLEYRYSDFGTASYDELEATVPAGVDSRIHDVRVGLAYKF
ncbi:OMP_b-brl domain-containing protein [Aminobacter niigataensis]|nr:OMP_b-brl domain-containing protein [Aminobacter niigataensis]